MPDVQPTREAIEARLERSRTQLVALHDEALEALRALDDWDDEHPLGWVQLATVLKQSSDGATFEHEAT